MLCAVRHYLFIVFHFHHEFLEQTFTCKQSWLTFKKEHLICEIILLFKPGQIKTMNTTSAQKDYQKRKRQIRFRIRQLIFKLIISKHWIQDIGTETVKITANPKENIARIIRRKIVKSLLTTREKVLLNIRPAARTNEQQKKLSTLFLNLECLEQFSPVIREKLARVAQFQSLEKDRVIFRTGHTACAMFILLDGNVSLTTDRWVEVKNAWEKQLFHRVVAGNFFGADSLLDQTKRMYSAQTTSRCDLLYIYTDEFNSILLDDMQSKRNMFLMALKQFQYFDSWTTNQALQCSSLSRFVQYDPNQIIHIESKELNYNLDDAIFLINGECNILQVIHYGHGKNRRYVVNASDDKASTKYFLIGCFLPGSVFNLDEECTGRIITSKTTIQCLLIPKFWLYQKEQNTANKWNEKVMDINLSLPSQTEIINNDWKEFKWIEFKRKLCKRIINEAPRKSMFK